MKLLKAKASNFGSYKEIEFDFNDQGLALIYGATGSGKSTLQDLPVWALFGQTAKDGNADDVRSWTSDEPTSVELTFLNKDNQLVRVVRTRGKSSSENDLFFEHEYPHGNSVYRGKDITETQKLLNAYLGIDAYLYTIGAYYNEFSPTGSFFTAKASDRRELFESLANLDLPVLLSERIGNAKKETRKVVTQVLEGINKAEGRYDQLKRSQIAVERDASQWEEKQARAIEELEIRSQNFEQEKESKIAALDLKIEAYEAQRLKTIEKHEKDKERKLKKFLIDSQCVSCGALKPSQETELLELEAECTWLIQKTEEDPNPFEAGRKEVVNQENQYIQRLEEEKRRSNPHLSQKDAINRDIITCQSHKKELKDQLDSLNHKKFSLEQLHKIIDELRGELLKNRVKSIEYTTNRYLETYFDSEIRVKFELDDSDKLDVLIWKSGHECSYKQLSKGQRGLLKLAFSVSAMQAVADKCGVHFDTLMLDEALDGLDENLKVKAFNLFSELALKHTSVLVIDHSESLQNLFDTKYRVVIDSDISHISEV